MKKKKIFYCLIFLICCFKLVAENEFSSVAKKQRKDFIMQAKMCIGCPYVYGATGPDSFDCSGLIIYCAQQALELQLPRTAQALYEYCKIIPKEKIESGDLVFFKTANYASITHVGIYIGKGQFISAISDGPNNGVIVSSLNQDYWKPKLVACGQLLSSAEQVSDFSENSNQTVQKTKKTVNKQDDYGVFKGSNFYDTEKSFFDSITFDMILSCGWSFFSPKQFLIDWRGTNIEVNARVSKWVMEPGLGVGLRYNEDLKIFQMPILISTTLNDYVRCYAGPVITFGKPTMFGLHENISPSFFPGILGITLSTPNLQMGKVGLQFIHDISFTIFNQNDNAALPFKESAAAGFVMFTGIKVTLGMGAFR